MHTLFRHEQCYYMLELAQISTPPTCFVSQIPWCKGGSGESPLDDREWSNFYDALRFNTFL